jgi:hypothetical protein
MLKRIVLSVIMIQFVLMPVASQKAQANITDLSALYTKGIQKLELLQKEGWKFYENRNGSLQELKTGFEILRIKSKVLYLKPAVAPKHPLSKVVFSASNNGSADATALETYVHAYRESDLKNSVADTTLTVDSHLTDVQNKTYFDQQLRFFARQIETKGLGMSHTPESVIARVVGWVIPSAEATLFGSIFKLVSFVCSFCFMILFFISACAVGLLTIISLNNRDWDFFKSRFPSTLVKWTVGILIVGAVAGFIGSYLDEHAEGARF